MDSFLRNCLRCFLSLYSYFWSGTPFNFKRVTICIIDFEIRLFGKTPWSHCTAFPLHWANEPFLFMRKHTVYELTPISMIRLSLHVDCTYFFLPICRNFKRPTTNFFQRFSAQISYIPTELFLIAFFIVTDIFFRSRSFSISCCSVVKEEISDEEMNLPCFNGRVVAWVSGLSFA